MKQLIYEHACSGMFSDELDRMGYRNQVMSNLFLNVPDGKIYGPIRTIKIQTIETDDERIEKGLGFLESLSTGDILCVEGSYEFAYFGELMSRLSMRRKVGGVVIGGLTRDSYFTHKLNRFPIFAKGYTAKDIKGRGRVQETDSSINIDGISMQPGDWAFGDKDSVVIVPKRILSDLESRIIAVINDEIEIIRKIDEGKTINEILKLHKEF